MQSRPLSANTGHSRVAAIFPQADRTSGAQEAVFKLTAGVEDPRPVLLRPQDQTHSLVSDVRSFEARDHRSFTFHPCAFNKPLTCFRLSLSGLS